MIQIGWWPIGRHLIPSGQCNPESQQMTLQENLDLAEIEADIAHEKYVEALEDDEHPQLLEHLNTEATLARHRYYAALNADLAL